MGPVVEGKRNIKSSLLVVCLGISLLAACAPAPTAPLVAELPTATPTVNPSAKAILTPTPTPAAHHFTYEVVNAYPHDRGAFTQGLVFENGVLYEGTGLHGRSSLRRVDLASGDVLQIRKLPDQLWGEGITIFSERIIQLTWQSGVGFAYDQNNLELLEEFHYPTEGWGITHDGERLIMSDGTSTLRFWNPETFEEIGRIEVRDEDGPVTRLNELEVVQGEIYANVWQTDRIARIAPDTGDVISWIDLAGLLSAADRSEPVDVLNGIAYDAENDRLFVTGKLWPRLFEIELIPLE
jgi:glutamine cyclotransferase